MRYVLTWGLRTKVNNRTHLKKYLVCRCLVIILLPLTMLCNKPRSHVKPINIKNKFSCLVKASNIYIEQGEASWYGGNGDGFAGNITANCEVYNPLDLTCAHRTLPFNTLVKVDHLATGKSVILRVNDRGPFIHGRIIDVSKKAAQDLGLLYSGIATVRLQTVDTQGRPAPMDFDVTQGNPYTIQIAAFADFTKARCLIKELEINFDQKIYQVKQTLNDTIVERVRVGTYPNPEQAEEMYKRLAKFCKERKLEPFITRQY